MKKKKTAAFKADSFYQNSSRDSLRLQKIKSRKILFTRIFRKVLSNYGVMSKGFQRHDFFKTFDKV